MTLADPIYHLIQQNGADNKNGPFLCLLVHLKSKRRHSPCPYPKFSKRPDLIPLQLRRKLGFKAGGKVQLVEEGGRVIVTPAVADPIAVVTGFLTGKFSLTDDLRPEHREEARHEQKTRAR